MVPNACRVLFALAVLVFAFNFPGTAGVLPLAVSDTPIGSPAMVDPPQLPQTASQKDVAGKRLRVRQIFVLWLLAAHPAR